MNYSIDNARAGATHAPGKAAHLRRVAAGWQAELRHLRMRKRGQDRRQAIAGALALARELEALAKPQQPLEVQVAELRQAGLTFEAVAATLGIPVGSAKTCMRRVRLGGVA